MPTSEIATRPDRSPVRSNWSELAKSEANPLLMLPAECRVPVMRLWMCNAHLMSSALALCATFRLYVDEHGLAASDVESVCDRLLDPTRRAGHLGSWVLMAELSALVADTLKTNKAREECEARRLEGYAAVKAANCGDLFKLSE